MEYVINKVEPGFVTVTFEDESWAKISVQENITEQEFDELVLMYGPKTHQPPEFIKEGQTRTASPRPQVQIENAGASVPTQQNAEPKWLRSRKEAYGPLDVQIEFITENGLQAWQDHVAEIKNLFPKE